VLHLLHLTGFPTGVLDAHGLSDYRQDLTRVTGWELRQETSRRFQASSARKAVDKERLEAWLCHDCAQDGLALWWDLSVGTSLRLCPICSIVLDQLTPHVGWCFMNSTSNHLFRGKTLVGFVQSWKGIPMFDHSNIFKHWILGCLCSLYQMCCCSTTRLWSRRMRSCATWVCAKRGTSRGRCAARWVELHSLSPTKFKPCLYKQCLTMFKPWWTIFKPWWSHDEPFFKHVEAMSTIEPVEIASLLFGKWREWFRPNGLNPK